MSSYCLKCRKNTENKKSKNCQTTNGRIMLLSKYSVFHNIKLKFLKEQEVKGFLSSLAIKAHLSQIPLLGPFLC